MWRGRPFHEIEPADQHSSHREYGREDADQLRETQRIAFTVKPSTASIAQPTATDADPGRATRVSRSHRRRSPSRPPLKR
ncbi:MAG TPA: hypothetical protein VHX65_12840 [Pirellulales bacterium]|jgi:hypothetical protein|nr:hypothetical protein [Pirellulales bacterium]